MAYQVLARKWRPKNFADLVGQEHVVKALRNALEKGRLHHAYLLTGTRGVGKTTIARILAKSLNCEHAHGGEPCGQCQSCIQIDSGRYVDLLEIDAASNTGIDNIREVLENAQYAPTAGKYKVYIIDEVHMLSKSAFNAMLKTLEEPPEHVKFILATTDPHKVPITVLSRCLQFVLRNMTPQQVAAHLAHVLQQEKIAYEDAALHILGRAAMGSMRDALSLLDQAIAMGSGSVTEQDVRQMIGAVDKHYLYDLLNGLIAQDGQQLLDTAAQMAARAVGFDHALSELALLLQRVALLQSVPSAISADDAEYSALVQAAQYLNGEQIQLYYQCAIHGKKDLALAPDEYAGFVMTLLRMLSFTPMAASGAPNNGLIEGSDLHDAEQAEGQAVKKFQPIRLPEKNSVTVKPDETTSAPESSISDESVNEMPVADVPREEENEIVEPEPSIQAASAAIPVESLPQTQAESLPENIEAPTSAEAEAKIPMESETQSVSQTTSSDTDVGEESTPPWEEVQENSNQSVSYVEETDFLNEWLPENETVHDEDDSTANLWTDSNELLPQLESQMLSETQPEVTDDTEDDEPTEWVPLPDFNGENWCVIMDRLAKRLGAAHMLAQHMAWVSFDSKTQHLQVALDNSNRVTGNRNYFERIRKILAQAYDLDKLNIQTCDWQEGQNWETPQMRKARIQEEGREQAQALLEADADCQKLMSALHANGWKKQTLTLFTAE